MVLPNGSVAVMIHTDDNNGWSGETIAVAPSWQGPYTVTVGNEAVNNEPLKQEDPFMWIDARGHYHALLHLMFDPPGMGPCGFWAGGHMASVDGTKWTPIYRSYNTTVRTVDGKTTVFGRRERPKLIFDTAGRPTHLFNGVIPASGNPYTAVAPINTPNP
jgi:hypothetical protein